MKDLTGATATSELQQQQQQQQDAVGGGTGSSGGRRHQNGSSAVDCRAAAVAASTAAKARSRLRRHHSNHQHCHNNGTNGDFRHRFGGGGGGGGIVGGAGAADDDDDDSMLDDDDAELDVDANEEDQLLLLLPPSEAAAAAAADVLENGGAVAAAVETTAPRDLLQALDRIPTRVEMLSDLANACTLAGAVLATLAMACMWKGRYYLGMCLNVAANVADIVDGPIARSTPGRQLAFSLVGSKLDTYSDLVSHFVVPASLLMHITDTNVFCTALAAVYICTGILRQSYFEVTGRCDGGTCIYGVTSDYMVVIYTLAMHLHPLLGSSLMPLLLCPCVLAMIACSLTFALRSRRYAGFGLFTVTAYNVSLWTSCLVLACFVGGGGGGDEGGGRPPSEAASTFFGGGGVPLALFAVHAVLAYPCYFRFVELNR